VQFARGDRDYVLRRPPTHLRDNSNATMLREARILKALSTTSIPHARFIALCEDETVLGCVFYLMEPVEGFNPASDMPPFHAGSPAVRHRMGLALVEGIAALGALEFAALGLADFGRPDNFLERQTSRWKSQLQSYAAQAGWPGIANLPDVEKIEAWLTENRPVTFQPGIMHGDFHLANVMYRHDSAELAAIVDWELVTIGDPLVDLGWLLATWAQDEDGGEAIVSVQPWRGFPSASELVDHYRQCTGRSLDDVDWYAIFACYKLAILLEGTYARACSGQAAMDVGLRLHARSVMLLDRAHKWIAAARHGREVVV